MNGAPNGEGMDRNLGDLLSSGPGMSQQKSPEERVDYNRDRLQKTTNEFRLRLKNRIDLLGKDLRFIEEDGGASRSIELTGDIEKARTIAAEIEQKLKELDSLFKTKK